MAAGPPRPSDPKAGGNKQALMDAFKSAKGENAPPNEAGGDAPGAPDAPGADMPGGPDPAVEQIGLKLDHLVNLLMSKGILAPQDIMSPPQVAPIGAPPGPGGPPPGGPAGPPPGAPPMQ